MGCASSAALPFLTTKENATLSDGASLNGKTSYELQTVSNSVNENGTENAKDVNDSFVTEKMKEVVDSSAVQGVIGGVVQVKEDICHQVKDVGDSIASKVASVVNGVEDTVESTFEKITGTLNAAEEKIISGIDIAEGGFKSLLQGGGSDEKVSDSIKPEDIDELLNALPEAEEEISPEETVKETVEEVNEEPGDDE